MLEQEAGRRRHSPANHQTGLGEPIQRPLKPSFPAPRNSGQQLVFEIPTDDSADLRNVSGIGSKPIETGHQRCVQTCRHGRRRGRSGGHNLWNHARSRPGFQCGAGQFLHEQRHTIRPADDLINDVRRQRPIRAGHLAHQCLALAPVQPVQQQRSDMRQTCPRRLKLRTEGEHKQHRLTCDLTDQPIEQVAAARVRPVDILEHSDDRPLPRQAGEMAKQRLGGSPPPLFR